MTRLHLDYETYSPVDIRKCGAYKYASHPDTEALMLGWAIDDYPVNLWLPHCQDIPTPLECALKDSSITKYAFNAQFERLITKYVLGVDVPAEQWRCTMVEAYYLSFTGGLGKVLQAIGLEDKDKRGGQLINIFSTPAPKNHKAFRYDWDNKPEEWQEFCDYCIQDVNVERQLYHWLRKFPTMETWDWQQWFLDQEINDRGVLMDVDMAESAKEIWRLETEDLKEQLSEATGLSSVTRGPFLQYLNTISDTLIENTQKDYLNQVSKREDSSDTLKHVIDLWQQKESKATAKYTAVVNASHPDDKRARGMFQYKGAARTDRVGGRLIQLQNLKRSFLELDGVDTLVSAIKCEDPGFLSMLYPMPVSEVLGGAIRHVIHAKPGHTLAVADLSSIESVVLGWVADCDLIDSTFRQGRDSYKVFASNYYQIKYDQVTKAQRSFSKPPVLGCGYMLGWRGLIAYAEGYGVKMEEDEARRAVETFRDMYPQIPLFWRWIDNSVKFVCMTGQPMSTGKLHIERDSDFLRIKLPSGRYLSYFKPEIQMRPAPWNPEEEIENFTFMGMDDRNQWCRLSAHAGLLTENIVQSIAGDILWQGLTNAKQAGLDIILHVHDEIGCEVPDQTAEQSLETLKQCLTKPLPWAPDMWLGASGYISKRFTKD